jgi:hypothetical protein
MVNDDYDGKGRAEEGSDRDEEDYEGGKEHVVEAGHEEE